MGRSAQGKLRSNNELLERMADLRTEMHALAGSNLRQMYTAMLGQTAVLLGVAYFFIL